MSLGHSSDDFNALLALAHKVQKELVGAPSQFDGISDKFVTLIMDQQLLTARNHRVRSLSIVLREIDVESELDNEKRTDLQRITISCRDVLIDLENSADSYDEPEPSHGYVSKKLKKAGKRVIREPEDIRELEDRITTNIEFLDAYLKQIVKSKDDDNQRSLWWAIWNNNLDMVKLSLDAGADVNSKDDDNQTPLWWAVQHDNMDMVKLLLDRGANIESRDTDGQTPLWGVQNDNMDMVKLLLDRGANIESKNTDGQTPLLWAAGGDNVDIVKLLLIAGANIESKNTDGRTPLLWAAENGNVDIVKLLLNAGANIESKNTDGRTPLLWAAENGNVDIVKLLLDAGADIESKDSNLQQTPLYSAVWNRNISIVKVLLDRGAEVGSKDDDQTPLGRAVRSRNKDIFEPLLNAGANVKSKDKNNQTPTAGPDALREVVGRFDVQAVEDFLTRAFNDVAIDDLSWLRELVEIGYGYQHIATLLVDEKKSPWIFIEPIQRSNAGVITDHHQRFCVHQGGNEVTYSPRLVAEDEAIRHIGNCHTSD